MTELRRQKERDELAPPGVLLHTFYDNDPKNDNPMEDEGDEPSSRFHLGAAEAPPSPASGAHHVSESAATRSTGARGARAVPPPPKHGFLEHLHYYFELLLEATFMGPERSIFLQPPPAPQTVDEIDELISSKRQLHSRNLALRQAPQRLERMPALSMVRRLRDALELQCQGDRNRFIQQFFSTSRGALSWESNYYHGL